MSRSHSFDNILDVGDKKISPKTSRHVLFGSVVRSNTNASNNSKASSAENFSEDQGDSYVELERRPVTIETYTALESYVAQSDICLAFKTGDCCALLKKASKNWWLVNIGGKEGWVPGSYWTPTSHVSNNNRVVCGSIILKVLLPHLNFRTS